VVTIKITRLAVLRILWVLTKPKAVLSLKPGEIKKVDDKLIAEKTSDGKIVLYEVVE